MSSVTRLLLQLNLPIIVLILYLALFIVINVRSRKQFDQLNASLKECSHDPSKCLELTNSYIRNNPFAQVNSTLRLYTIPLLLNSKNDEIKKCIDKIRVADVEHAAVDMLIYAIFQLREYGYQEEYDQLKNKFSKKYEPIQSRLYQQLIQKSVDAEKLPEESFSDLPVHVRAIVAYHKGEMLFHQGKHEAAQHYFAASTQATPQMQHLLKRKGYAE